MPTVSVQFSESCIWEWGTPAKTKTTPVKTQTVCGAQQAPPSSQRPAVSRALAATDLPAFYHFVSFHSLGGVKVTERTVCHAGGGLCSGAAIATVPSWNVPWGLPAVSPCSLPQAATLGRGVRRSALPFLDVV